MHHYFFHVCFEIFTLYVLSNTTWKMIRYWFDCPLTNILLSINKLFWRRIRNLAIGVIVLHLNLIFETFYICYEHHGPIQWVENFLVIVISIGFSLFFLIHQFWIIFNTMKNVDWTWPLNEHFCGSLNSNVTLAKCIHNFIKNLTYFSAQHQNLNIKAMYCKK